MMNGNLPPQFVNHLAELAHMLRTRPGFEGQPWDIPGIKSAILECGKIVGPAETMKVVAAAADNAKLNTPGAIAKPGLHWTGTPQANAPRPVNCPEHEHEKAGACRICERAATPRPADFYEQMDRAREAARIQREYDIEQGKSYL